MQIFAVVDGIVVEGNCSCMTDESETQEVHVVAVGHEHMAEACMERVAAVLAAQVAEEGRQERA